MLDEKNSEIIDFDKFSKPKRIFHTFTKIRQDEFFLFGGRDEDKVYNNSFIFNTKNNLFTTVSCNFF